MQCTVPDIWKRANVSPVHEKDDKGSVDNYRPISLLSSVGKTMVSKLLNQQISKSCNTWWHIRMARDIGWCASSSILGPRLFIMFKNDIVKEIHSNIRLFADDTSLYIIVDFPDSAAQILNVDLERLYEWAVQWLVRFNPNKTVSLLFSRKLNIHHHPTLCFNDVLIQEVVSHKHLGVYLSQRCDWHNHIDFIKEKAWP